MRTSRTLIPAVVAVVGLLLATTAPAGATGPFPIDVVAGTFTHALGTLDLTPGSQGTPPCQEKATTLATTFDGTASSGTWRITGAKTRQLTLPAGYPNMPWYQIEVTYLNGSGGTYAAVGSPPPTNTLAGVMGIRIQIHQIQLSGGPVDCTKSNLRCIITGAFTITSGDYTGNPLPNPLTGDTLDLSSTSGPLVTSSCTAPFNSLAGTTATLDQVLQLQ